MGRFDTTKATINANIKSNGNQEITGSVLNSVLQEIVDGTDAQLTELSEKVGKNSFAISNVSEAQTIYEQGLILWANGSLSQSGSASYGVVYFPIQKGKAYHIFCSSTERFTNFANVAYSATKPADGSITQVLSSNYADGVKEIDFFYQANDAGYLCFMVWAGNTYVAEEADAYKDVISQNEVIETLNAWGGELPIAIDKQGWGRIENTLYEGILSNLYYMSEYVSTELYSRIKAMLYGNGVIDVISFYDKDKNYLSQLAVRDGGLGEYDIDLTEEKYADVRYVSVGYYYMEDYPTMYATLVGELATKLTKADSSFLYKEDNIAIERVGWGRIGDREFAGNLGEKYRASEYVDVRNCGGINATLQGNGTVDTISFFNKDRLYIGGIVGAEKRRYSILLSNPLFKDVAFVQIGLYDGNSNFAGLTASTIPILDKRYKKSYARKLLCIGDSLTNSIPQSAPSGEYPHKWSEDVCFNLNIPYCSLGGGAGANLANVGDNTIYSRVMALEKDENVDIVTLWGGTNDWNNGVQLGEFETQVNISTRDDDTYIGALCSCVEKLLGFYPTSKIILVGTTPRTRSNGIFTHHNDINGVGLYLNDYVDAMSKVADWYGLPFLDLLHKSGINTLNIQEYMYPQYDNEGAAYYLHFNQKGENLIAEKVSSFITTL